TTYYVCAIASNSLGTSFGTPVSFTTLDAPAVVTQPATSLTTTYAQLNASATGWFRMSPTNPGTCNDSFGTRLPSSSGTGLGSGRAAVAYSYLTYNVLNLSPG